MKIDSRELLRNYSKKALVEIARFNDLYLDGNKKESIIETLAKRLFTRDAVQAALQQLGEVERKVLDRLILVNGEADTEVFRQELLNDKVVEEPPQSKPSYGYYGGYSTYQPSPEKKGSRVFEDVVARLTVRGLVFSKDPANYTTTIDFKPGRTLFIPDQVLQHLPKPERTATRIDHRIKTEQLASARTFQRDLYLYWSYLRWNPVAPTARGLMPKRDLLKVNATLQTPEDLAEVRNEDEAGRTYFLRILLQDAKLIRYDRGEWVVPPDSQEFLKKSLSERTAVSFDAWCQSTNWNELLRIPTKPDMTRNRDRRAAQPVIDARQYVIEQVKSFPAGAWVAFEDLVQQIKLRNYGFLFPRKKQWGGFGNPYNSYNNPLAWEFNVSGEALGWLKVEKEFIRAILVEPMHWLGLVDLGFEGNNLVAFRITPEGAQALGLAKSHEKPVEPGKIIVQPNFQIFALDPVSEYTLSVLDTFADRRNVDRAIEYQLNRQSVYRAHQVGMEVDAILAFLEREAHTDIPQNVRRTLEEWGAEQDRIVIRRSVDVVQTVDPGLLESLLEDPRTAHFFARRSGPNVAVLQSKKGTAKAFHQTLEAQGYLPAGGKDHVAGSIQLQPNGRIHFLHPAPSFYVLRRLAPLAEHNDGDWRLTPASIKQAVAQGQSLENILRTLRECHSGPLPTPIETAIKAWGKYYGEVILEQVTLLRVQDEKVLAELRQDPEIGPLLKRFAANGALAVVKEGKLERLEAALRGKGVEVKRET